MLKRGYQGIFHKISTKHLDRYVTEFAGRHNMRILDTVDMMVNMVIGMVGKRIRYRELGLRLGCCYWSRLLIFNKFVYFFT